MTTTIIPGAVDKTAIDHIHDLTDAYLITHDPTLLADIAAAVDTISRRTPPEDTDRTLACAIDAILRSPLNDQDAATALAITVDNIREGRRLAALLGATR